ncbi:hypothetical protein niasHS_002048 [Heterodera schachtii]|uniref:Aspartic peptidase DDI1-type domain-containing protein n=1 Tax=Heterodera schachtii TaxID=97005 RepID=A0ABD2K5P5_HETSC
MTAFLYIRMKANDCPLIAFVRSGCTTSFISESFARKANLLGNIDRSNREKIPIPIGAGGKVLGWVNDVQIRIDELNLQFVYRLGVMEDKHLPIYCKKKFDMLLATDLLYDVGLDLHFGKGRFAVSRKGKMVKALTVEQIQSEMEDTY